MNVVAIFECACCSALITRGEGPASAVSAGAFKPSSVLARLPEEVPCMTLAQVSRLMLALIGTILLPAAPFRQGWGAVQAALSSPRLCSLDLLRHCPCI